LPTFFFKINLATSAPPRFFLQQHPAADVRIVLDDVNQEARMQPTLPAAPQEHGPLHDHPAAGDEVRNL
jgi:hypothetical protein